MQQPETTQMRRKNRKKILAAKYVAAGCEPRTARESENIFSFRPCDNSLFTRHLTHAILLCNMKMIVYGDNRTIQYFKEFVKNFGEKITKILKQLAELMFCMIQ